MRVLFGIVLGVALTVGAAFIADSWGTDGSTNGSSSSTVEHRKMVNWEVVGENMRIARERNARNLEQDFAQDRQLIPSLTDQNPCAHWRNPMDMMRHG